MSNSYYIVFGLSAIICVTLGIFANMNARTLTAVCDDSEHETDLPSDENKLVNQDTIYKKSQGFDATITYIGSALVGVGGAIVLSIVMVPFTDNPNKQGGGMLSKSIGGYTFSAIIIMIIICKFILTPWNKYTERNLQHLIEQDNRIMYGMLGFSVGYLLSCILQQISNNRAKEEPQEQTHVSLPFTIIGMLTSAMLIAYGVIARNQYEKCDTENKSEKLKSVTTSAYVAIATGCLFIVIWIALAVTHAQRNRAIAKPLQNEKAIENADKKGADADGSATSEVNDGESEKRSWLSRLFGGKKRPR